MLSSPPSSTRDPTDHRVLEPTGVAPPAPPSVKHEAWLPASSALPPTPRDVRSRKSASHPSPIAALLVGTPPPPPETPPPSRRHRKTPRRNRRPSPPPSSMDETAETTTTSSSTALASSIVEERRRAALAMYKSEELVCDTDMMMMEQQQQQQQQQHPQRKELPQRVRQRRSSKDEPSAPRAAAPPAQEAQPAVPPPPVAIPSSPRSEATEPHSNRQPQRKTVRTSTSSEPRLPPSQPRPKNSAPTTNASKTSKSNRKGGGFFKKIFGGNNTNSTTKTRNKRAVKQPQSSSGGVTKEQKQVKSAQRPRRVESKTVTEPTPAKNTTARPIQTFQATEEPVALVSEKHMTAPPALEKGQAVPKQAVVTDDHPLSPSKKSRQQESLQRGGFSITNGFVASDNPYREEVFFSNDDVSTLTTPTMQSAFPSRKEPPREPLPSSTPIIYEEGGSAHHSSNSDDPIGHYWNTSFPTTHAAPSSSKSIDPFTEPFFQQGGEPDGESPPQSIVSGQLLPTPAASFLHIDTTATKTVKDPVGESPHAGKMAAKRASALWMDDGEAPHFLDPVGKSSTLQSSSLPPQQHQDPIGESPMHATQKLPSSTNAYQDPVGESPMMGSVRAPQFFFRDDVGGDDPSAVLDGTPYTPDPPLKPLKRGYPPSVENDSAAVEEKKEDFLTTISQSHPPKRPSTHRSRGNVELLPPAGPVRSNKLADSDAPPSPSVASSDALPFSSLTESDVPPLSSLADSDAPLEDLAPPPPPPPPKVVSKQKRSKNRPSETSKKDPAETNRPKKRSSSETAKKSPVAEDVKASKKSNVAKSSKQSFRERRRSAGRHSVEDVEPVHLSHVIVKKPEAQAGGDDDSVQLSKISSLASVDASVMAHEKQNAESAKPFTINTAALMNAQTIAYIHTLNGEPSPRHSWRNSHDELKPKISSQNLPPTKELNTDQSPPAKELSKEEDAEMKSNLFSGVHSKFRNRKPSNLSMRVVNDTPVEVTASSKLSVSGSTTRQRRTSPAGASVVTSQSWASVKEKSVVTEESLMESSIMSRIVATERAITYGLELRRLKRKDDIASGRVIPVQPTKRPNLKMKTKQTVVDEVDESKLDPIQRAGRRLLSKAAIPIQSAARRYLAQREAVDRMWALIEIQSYLRRWRCEALLLSCTHSAVRIQAVFRGWSTRDSLSHQNYCATQIQRIVRGHLAAAYAYDLLYWIIRLQSIFRGWLVREDVAHQDFCALIIQRAYRQHSADMKYDSATVIQAVARGFLARSRMWTQDYAATTIQTFWRSASAQLAFQFNIVDIIIAQSMARKWLAKRRLESLRNAVQYAAARSIQTKWRAYHAHDQYVRYIAARRIQASWRGFQAYTDFIFALVDVLVVQRTVRQWMATRQVKQLRETRAATKIQSQYRRHKSQVSMLYQLVHIIIVQSVARRYLVRSRIRQQIQKTRVIQSWWRTCLYKKQQGCNAAALKIQTAWRAFWSYSHFIILQYEATRLQARVRGNIARSTHKMRLGSAIMMQATARVFLARRRLRERRINNLMVAAAARGMRQKISASRIQRWWRIILDWHKEKASALIIERFFLMVKSEVDREIRRREKKLQSRKEKRRRKKKEADEKLLERVWLNTVDENRVDVFAYPSLKSTRSKSTPRLRSNHSGLSDSGSSFWDEYYGTTENSGVKHQASSPSMKMVMRHENDHSSSNRHHRGKPTDSVRLSIGDEASEVSGITSPSVFHRQAPPRQTKLSRKEMNEDLSLEEAFLDSEVNFNKEQKKSHAEYLQRYGLKTAPSSSSSRHFFSDDSPTHKSRSSRRDRERSDRSQSSRGDHSRGRSSNGNSTTPRSKGERSTTSNGRRHYPSTGVGYSPTSGLQGNPISPQSEFMGQEVEYLGENYGMI